ncbi:MAG TPA: DUF1489 domain-containing protein [Alphaproteobacteria bacterium]|nr:DUF1489 domain-containing protein [Alphaproteobacteria bacterium]
MTLHIIKLCVGCDSVEDLGQWQRARLAKMRRRNPKARLRHVTRMMPKRAQDVLDGGSLYWVIKGYVRVRQRIIGLRAVRNEEGATACAIELAPRLIKTQLVAWRPFQGWRYLAAEEAPPDLPPRAKGDDDLPPRLAAALRELGLL